MNEQKTITITKDKKVPNTIEILVTGESHTLGNLLSQRLHEDSRCIFSAYKVAHPLNETFSIKVTAIDEYDALALVVDVLKELRAEVCGCIAQIESF
ncbi:DNA-directed RNA polymerase II subunit RPB11-a [Conglomerata obtusa]